MDQDTAILINDLHRSFADVGFALIFGAIVTVALVWAAIVRGPLTGALSFFLGFFIGLALFSWAGSASPAESHEVVQACAIIIGCSIFGMVAISIVQRAPPTALLAIFSILAVGVLIGVLALWADFANLFLLMVCLLFVGLVAAIAILAWAVVRKEELAAQREQIPWRREPEPPRIADRVADRGRLEAPRKGGLPAKR